MALLVGLCFAGFLFAFCERRHNFSASLFAYAGSAFCDPKRVPQNLIVNANDGYDGQFFYRLALNPFTHQATAYGITIDAPPYRQQRIFYPFLAYLLDLGNPLNASRTLLLLNLAGIVGIAYLGALFAQEKRLHALWGVLIGLNPGMFFTLQRDTSEIVATFLALLTLHLARRQKYLPSALALTCAILTRETTIIIGSALLVSLFIARVPRKQELSGEITPEGTPAARRKRDYLPYLIPFLVFAVWQAWLTHLWGKPPSAYGGQNIGLPFAGVWQRLTNPAISNGPENMPILVAQLFFVGFVLIQTAGELRESSTDLAVKIAWGIYALFGICYSFLVYIEDYSFMRVQTDLFALSGLILLGGRSRARWQVLLVLLAVDLLQGHTFIYYR